MQLFFLLKCIHKKTASIHLEYVTHQGFQRKEKLRVSQEPAMFCKIKIFHFHIRVSLNPGLRKLLIKRGHITTLKEKGRMWIYLHELIHLLSAREVHSLPLSHLFTVQGATQTLLCQETWTPKKTEHFTHIHLFPFSRPFSREPYGHAYNQTFFCSSNSSTLQGYYR